MASDAARSEETVEYHLASEVSLVFLRPSFLRAPARSQRRRETSIAKKFATEAAFSAASEAVQVHGAYGYSDEYPVGRFWRNSKGAVIYEGTREIHTLMQADYALGYRVDRPARVNLPPYGKVETKK